MATTVATILQVARFACPENIPLQQNSGATRTKITGTPLPEVLVMEGTPAAVNVVRDPGVGGRLVVSQQLHSRRRSG